MMARIAGVVYSRNDRNLGFIGSCNRAATLHGASTWFFSTTTRLSRPAGLRHFCVPFVTYPEPDWLVRS